MSRYTIHLGDCLHSLRLMPDNSVDSVVTDPPYGLSFMGKKWDYDVPSVDVWAECLRVLKPGGYLLAFAGTRTQHRMAVRIEDAGFEIRDLIAWVYGSGFPKSHNGEWGGTALKPALEPITMARKPLAGTVEANWREHVTGALNIDGCRVGGEHTYTPRLTANANMNDDGWQKIGQAAEPVTAAGRWPANLIHDGSDEVVGLFPETGKSTGGRIGNAGGGSVQNVPVGKFEAGNPGYGDTGSAARFFYCAKASKTDRGEGNTHPTVKPTDLMRYLTRLVTPPGGTVLDPFAGSGSTGKACALEGFEFIGIEREAEYCDIARARIAHVVATEQRQEQLFA